MIAIVSIGHNTSFAVSTEQLSKFLTMIEDLPQVESTYLKQGYTYYVKEGKNEIRVTLIEDTKLISEKNMLAIKTKEEAEKEQA